MNLNELLQAEASAETLALWLKKVPYAAYLGIRAEHYDNDIRFVLPADKKLVGNPSLPALHGGVVGAFMEQSAAFYLIARMDNPVLPKIINFSLDYLRPVRLQDAYAGCHLTRQGRMIANVAVTVWQEDPERPCATARAHFSIPDNN